MSERRPAFPVVGGQCKMLGIQCTFLRAVFKACRLQASERTSCWFALRIKGQDVQGAAGPHDVGDNSILLRSRKEWALVRSVCLSLSEWDTDISKLCLPHVPMKQNRISHVHENLTHAHSQASCYLTGCLWFVLQNHTWSS